MAEALNVLFRDCITPYYDIVQKSTLLGIESQKRLQEKQRVLSKETTEIEYAQRTRQRYQDTLSSYETMGSLFTSAASIAIGVGALATAAPTWIAYSAITGGSLSLVQEAAKAAGIWKKVAGYFYEDPASKEEFALQANRVLATSAFLSSAVSSAFLLHYQVDLALKAMDTTKHLLNAGKTGLFTMQMYNGHHLEKTKALLNTCQLKAKQLEEDVSDAASSAESQLKDQQKATEIYHQLTEKAIQARQIATAA